MPDAEDPPQGVSTIAIGEGREHGPWPRRMRRTAVVAFSLAVVSSLVMFGVASSRHTEHIPWFLATALCAGVAVVAALVGLRQTTTALRIGLVVLALAALGVAVTTFFFAWMIAVFPKC